MSRDDIQSVIENVDRSASVELVEDIAGPRSAQTRSFEQVYNRQPLLVLLLEFADREFCTSYLTAQFPTTTSHWSNHFFGNQGRTVNEWYRENSGDFNLQYIKPSFLQSDGFSVQNPIEGVTSVTIQDGVARVRLTQNHPNHRPFGGVNSTVANLAFEAVRSFIDFSDIPRSGNFANSEYFNTYVIFAGYCASSAGGASRHPHVSGHADIWAWSHLDPWRSLGLQFSGNVPTLRSRGVQGELHSPGNASGIGTTVHELAHLLGVPDLYDYTGQSSGVSFYSVMAAGSWGHAAAYEIRGTSPVHFGPWEKIALGFAEPNIVAVDDIVGSQIFDVTSHNTTQGYEVLKVTSDVNPRQHFLVENRQQAGFDRGLFMAMPSIFHLQSGILIWHIDNDALDAVSPHHVWFAPNDNWMHKSVAVEGIERWNTGGQSVFRANGRNAFNAETTPNSNFHEPGFCTFRSAAHNCHPQTVPSNVDIEILSNTASTMQVRVNGAGEQEPCCPIVAYGRLPDQVGGEALRGAPWELCECGILTVGEGFIHWEGWSSPWASYVWPFGPGIGEIVFTGPITAGESLMSLFAGLVPCCCFSCCCISSWSIWGDKVTLTTIEGLEHFDTSSVTSMRNMFGWTTSLTSLDLSSWDTSNVVDMSNMFAWTHSLTSLDVSNFDTSNVKDMSNMFAWTHSLTSLDVSNFDTSSVVNMNGMFSGTSSLTSLDVSNFDTSNVTNISNMFGGTSSLTSLDVSNFDTSSVVNMNGMFSGTSSLTSLDVSNFDTGNVTNMSFMFSNARSLTSLDVSHFDTSRVTTMQSMFSQMSSLTSLDLSSFDTSRVTNMWGMFQLSGSLASLDLSSWDTSNVTSMGSMFYGARSLTELDLSNWDTSRVTNMGSMFTHTNSLTKLDLSNWDTSRVTGMHIMFLGASSLTELDLSNWDTSRVTNMGRMFSGTSSLTSLDISNFDTGNVTDIRDMFLGADSLKILALGENFQFIIQNPRWPGTPNLPAVRATDYFTGYWQNVGSGTVERPQGTHVLTSAQLMSQFNGATMADTWVWQPVVTGCPIVRTGQFADQVGGGGLRGASWTLCECGVVTVSEGFIHWEGWPSPWSNLGADVNKIVFTGPITAGESLANLFADFYPCWEFSPFRRFNVKTIKGLEHFDTSKTTSMSRMFANAHSLTSLDVSNFDTSNVTNMFSMFNGTHSLTSLDLSGWDTSSVTNMSWMFASTHSLTNLDLAHFDTSNVTDMASMFGGASSLTDLDISGWDTSRLTTTNSMFAGTNSLTNLDLSGWDTSSVTNMAGMFGGASSLTDLDMSGWDTSNVTTMSFMFGGASSLVSLDVSNLDTSRVTTMQSMFSQMSSLTSLDLSNFDTSNVTNMWGMFQFSSSLVSLDISSFNTGRVTTMDAMLSGTTSLNELTLGRNFAFWGHPGLPPVTPTDHFTGYWQNVGSGTVERPQGTHVLTSARLMNQFNGATMADTWVWQPVITECPVVAEGSFANQAGAGGIAGATWEMCECGVLTVNGGFINWNVATSPWHAQRADITEIVFTDTITTGMSLTNLFRDLSNVTEITGLENFNTSSLRHVNALFFGASSLTSLDLSSWDTSELLNTPNMFSGASSLTELDLTGWNTSRVTNMGSMFQGTSSLTTLDLSHFNTASVTSMNAMFNGMTSLTTLNIEGFNTSSVTNMNNMFWNSSSLRTLVLGQDFEFRGTPNLPAVPNNGRWQNVGSGTVDNPQGSYVLTSAQLMAQFDGAAMADTWVWQP